MKPTPKLPPPPISLDEEWDNPAMAEFKRQEAEDRVAFAETYDAQEWLDAMRDSSLRDQPIMLASKPPKRFPFKLVRLPW